MVAGAKVTGRPLSESLCQWGSLQRLEMPCLGSTILGPPPQFCFFSVLFQWVLALGFRSSQLRAGSNVQELP